MAWGTASGTTSDEPWLARVRHPSAVVAGGRAIPAAAPSGIAGDAASLLPADVPAARRGRRPRALRRVHAVLVRRERARLRQLSGRAAVVGRSPRRAAILPGPARDGRGAVVAPPADLPQRAATGRRPHPRPPPPPARPPRPPP